MGREGTRILWETFLGKKPFLALVQKVTSERNSFARRWPGALEKQDGSV